MAKLQFRGTTSWYLNQYIDLNINNWDEYQWLIKVSIVIDKNINLKRKMCVDKDINIDKNVNIDKNINVETLQSSSPSTPGSESRPARSCSGQKGQWKMTRPFPFPENVNCEQFHLIKTKLENLFSHLLCRDGECSAHLEIKVSSATNTFRLF